MEPIIQVDNISKVFKTEVKQAALENVSFGLQKSSFTCVVGPSGCGKSTLLRIIAGLMKPSAGKIIINERIKQAMVFQNFALFPWLTVEDNVSFGLKMHDKDEKQSEKIVAEEIEKMGLTGVTDKHPKELSGGMKQRVGIARALTVSPDLLLLDEPFSSLDVFTANKLRRELLSIWQERNLTVLMVSHLVEEAVQLADEVIVFSAAPGKVEMIKKVELPRPRNLRSDAFYKTVDEIQAKITIS